MAAELTINKSLTANGTIKVEDKIAMSLFAEISTNGGNDRITQSIQDKDVFNKNKKEIRAQVAAFQETVWEMQDSISEEQTDNTTEEEPTDAVRPASEAYSAEREDILSRYAQKDENGQYLVNDDCYVIPDQEGYAEDIEELLKIETEVEIQKVTVDILEKCDDPRYDALTIEELTALEFMTE